jgi:hypothetical protein
MVSSDDNSEFLSDDRLKKVGSVNSVLLRHGAYWIHRRKESIAIVDETTVRRTASVDFTLPEEVDKKQFDAVIQRPLEGKGEPVFCPPLFVLPKADDELMSFDLRNEAGVSLPLMTRRDNAFASAETLNALAADVLGVDEIAPGLSRRLTELATANTVRPIAAERLMRAGEDDPDYEELKILRENRNFVWWLWTLAHSSLVGVPFRDPYVRRKIFVLSYVERFVNTLRVRTRLGWTPYSVAIDLPWIGARNFHFEAESPPGLRIAEATLVEDDDDELPLVWGEQALPETDDEAPAAGDGEEDPLENDEIAASRNPPQRQSDEPTQRSGFLRRVHLTRYEATTAGAATVALDLRVNGHGFVGGAVLACGLVVGAIGGCLLQAEEIAKSPSSAPAALLLLPGLIATYVGRPDQHALTTRLLSFARWLLLIAGGAAYGCAAFVALGGEAVTPEALKHRTDDLQLAFSIGGAIATLSLLGLTIGWLLARPAVRGLLRGLVTFRWLRSAWKAVREPHFAHSIALPLSRSKLTQILEDQHRPLLNLANGSHEEYRAAGADELAFLRYDLASTWLVGLCVSESDGEIGLKIHGRCFPRLLARPVLPLLLLREARAARARLESLSETVRSK